MKLRELLAEDIADLGAAYQQYVNKPISALVAPAAASAKPPTIPTSLPAKIQDKAQPAGPLKMPSIQAKAEPAPFNPATHKDLLIKVAKKMGVTNVNDLSNLLGQVHVETSGWTKATENFNYTDPTRIYKVFTSNFPTPQAAQPYIGNPVALANRALANKNGNGAESTGDGWNFRGRGFIHLTGKELYAQAGAALHPENPGIYLSNPALLSSNPVESAKASIWYFLHKVGKGKSAKHTSKVVNPAGLKSAERNKATLAAKNTLKQQQVAAIPVKKTRKS